MLDFSVAGIFPLECCERRPAIRIRRPVGSMERPAGPCDRELHHPDDHSKFSLGDIHDRMPAILSPDNYDLWLDPAFRNPPSVSEMLKPFDATIMRRYPVSTRVNQVQNDDADCTTPIETDSSPSQAQLF